MEQGLALQHVKAHTHAASGSKSTRASYVESTSVSDAQQQYATQASKAICRPEASSASAGAGAGALSC